MNTNLQKQFVYSDKILDIIACQARDDTAMTQSDLQGCVDALVMRIMREAGEPTVNKDTVKNQWGMVSLAIAEMAAAGTTAGFELFINRMVALGVLVSAT